jgi:uncharacterized protein YndB with AHSA1/START domain
MSNVEGSETTLRLERLIASPPEVLFKFWIDPVQLLKWWGPDGYEVSIDTLETQPGGRWRIILRRSDGDAVAMSGVYRVIDPPRRLAFTWAWENPSGARGHETEVEVKFELAPGGTRLVLLHQRFQSKQARDNHAVGWSSSFDRLTKVAG